MIENHKKEGEAPKEPVVFETIDHFAFQQVWKNYVELLVQEKKTYLVRLLEVFPPELTENRAIIIRVGNDSHLHALNQDREAMYYFLKKSWTRRPWICELKWINPSLRTKMAESPIRQKRNTTTWFKRTRC